MFSKPVADAKTPWPFALVTGALILSAFFLRLYRIGDAELWIDEAFSVYAATVKTDLAKLLLNESSPPLYYLLLRLWVTIAGTGEAELRLLSAVLGTLFVATVIWAGTKFFDRRVGLWAGAFAAVAPIHIYYSQEARSYALLGLLILLTHVLLWRALARDTWPSWLLVSLVAALAVYTHYLAVLALPPTAMLVWAGGSSPDKFKAWRRYGAAMGGCALLLLPWIVWGFVLSPHALVGLDWLAGTWNATPPALAIPKSFEVLGLGSQAGWFPPLPKGFAYVSFPPSLRLLGIGVLLLLAVWAAIPWMDERLRMPAISRRKAWLGATLLFPLAALWMLSYFVKPIYYVGRYDQLAFCAYALLIGLGMAKFQASGRYGPWLAVGLAASLCLPIGDKLRRYYDATSTTAVSGNIARLVSQAVFRDARDGDVVVFTGLRGISIVYYLDRLGIGWSGGVCEERMTGRRFGCRFYPRESERHPAVQNVQRVIATPSEALADVQDFLAGLRGLTGRLWVSFGRVTYLPGSDVDTWKRSLKPEDVLLVEALQNMGFHLEPSNVGMLLFEATRQSPG